MKLPEFVINVDSAPGTFEEWRSVLRRENWSDTRVYDVRSAHIAAIGFPILTKETLRTLTGILWDRRVIEVGCGTGYLTRQLYAKGINIRGVDTYATKYGLTTEIATMRRDSHSRLQIRDATRITLSIYQDVIMSWPDYESPFAFKVAGRMKPGQRLLYQGESYSGCTANEDFFELLSKEFEEDECLTDALSKSHHQFYGIHDTWSVYRKIDRRKA